MSMSLGGGGKQRAEMNVTPLIDVLLVLIIIFLVITPMKQRGLNTLVPQSATDNGNPVAPAHEIVITVAGDGQVRLNQEPLDRSQLNARLVAMFRYGAPDVVFIRGERGLEFRDVAEVIDLARGAGVSRVGLMTQ